jgi:hypothetical protein
MGMNPRIRELAEQAEDWADSQNFYESDYRDYLMEKFAELIVRECASIIESQDVDPAFRHRMAWAVKQRFGVQE